MLWAYIRSNMLLFCVFDECPFSQRVTHRPNGTPFGTVFHNPGHGSRQPGVLPSRGLCKQGATALVAVRQTNTRDAHTVHERSSPPITRSFATGWAGPQLHTTRAMA